MVARSCSRTCTNRVIDRFVCCACLPAEGLKAETAYAKDGTLPDPDSTTNPELKIVFSIIKEGLSKDPTK
jgi:hypothetical protein